MGIAPPLQPAPVPESAVVEKQGSGLGWPATTDPSISFMISILAPHRHRETTNSKNAQKNTREDTHPTTPGCPRKADTIGIRTVEMSVLAEPSGRLAVEARMHEYSTHKIPFSSLPQRDP